jgi:hypothetical protein
MGKLLQPELKPGSPDYLFFCPGCKCAHGVWTTERNGNHALWGFNGDINNPTFSPSIRVQSGNKDGATLCHSFIRDGKIQYLDDCAHELAGKTIELPDFDNE